jgi:proline dehydrogenase
VEQQGLFQTLDYLGEGVSSLAEADAATRDYLRIIDAIIASGIERNISLKMTQLGLDVDRASAVDNLRKILEKGDGFFVRVDMESSSYTDVTLDIFETLWGQGHRQIGAVLQADLYRSATCAVSSRSGRGSASSRARTKSRDRSRIKTRLTWIRPMPG